MSHLLSKLIMEKKLTQELIEGMNAHFKLENEKRGEPPHKDIWNVLGNERNLIELFNWCEQYGFITKVD
jgi:hypothetical protein